MLASVFKACKDIKCSNFGIWTPNFIIFEKYHGLSWTKAFYKGGGRF
jgi:hypothetical protein